MWRTLATFLSAIATVLCAALIFFWVRSHTITDLLILGTSSGHYFEIVTVPGHLRVTRVSGPVPRQPLRWYRGSPPPTVPVFGQSVVYMRNSVLPGLALIHGSRRVTSPGSRAAPITVTYTMFATPFPLPVLVTGVIAIWPWLRRRSTKRKREDRLARGLCPDCGYDLRGSPGRCPECGAAQRV